MIIDFANLEEAVVNGFKGGEGEAAIRKHEDENGRIMRVKLQPGASLGYHVHDTSSEIIYVISGEADILYDEVTEHASAGECHYCLKGHGHSVRNNSNEELVVFAVIPEQ